ncbi:30S ribosomal protein S4 [Candidatus Bipolaricaulota bacterium]|nr:30S ribosomal protein S4 [Candidatus Bipolaricaulota bacterium]HHR86251.1 30S ribosomal protein S4 [Candidatus Acetothermia bacterium]
MGRDTGPKCKKCRREGEKLFLKGERCYTQSCPMSRRSSPPGERAKKHRPRRSQYQLHLREKQKARRIYGVRERQFRSYVDWAKRQKGVTGEALLKLLERRLDNVVYRAGFASSRDQARQMITHGHFEVNGRATNVPSVLLREGDTVAVKEGRRARVKGILDANKDRETPSWLEKNADAMKFQTIATPNLEETGYTIAANLIVEFYSR